MSEELSDNRVFWASDAVEYLVGRRIKAIRYLTDKEMADLGFSKSCVVLVLDDDNCLYPSRDDEGNDAGALFTTYRTLPVIPTV